MGELIKLVILGEPTAQKRHRHRSFGKFVQQYDPSAADKGDFLSIVQKNAPDTPLNIPLRVDMKFFFARPNSHYHTGAKAGIVKANAPKWHIARPDVDNLQKFVFDALNKIYWRDDSIVVVVTVLKMYSERPRTEIIITLPE